MVRRKCGRPAAAQNWKERACKQAKGWGECPADRRSASTDVRSSLSARSARPTSCPHRCPQKPLMHNICKGGKKSKRVKKLRRGGDNGEATRPTRGRDCANRAIKRASAFLPDLPSATRKEQRFALQESPTGKTAGKTSVLRPTPAPSDLAAWSVRGLLRLRESREHA